MENAGHAANGSREDGGKMGFIKRLAVFALILIVAGAGILWFYRYEIVRYSAEKIIKAALPEYVRVDDIIVDPENGELTAQGLALLNPSGFHNRYMVTVDRVFCRFRMKGEHILDGIRITDVRAEGPRINIERLEGGKVNLGQLGKKTFSGKRTASPDASDDRPSGSAMPGTGLFEKMDLAEKVEFPGKVEIKDGKITFMDKKVSRQGYVLTFERVNGDVTFRMSEDNAFLREVGSEGRGDVNGDPEQTVSWRIFWEPPAKGLTLSSRFRLDMVDVMPFKPYYDRYAPVNILQGWMSGTLVFDFDNGNIGSTNEVRLYRLEFTERSRGNVSGFWNVAVSDIVKYLRTARDEITFDFKVKGDMDSPTIYPGPHVRKAIQMLALDTIDQLVSGPEQKAGGAEKDTTGGGASGSEDKSDAEKVVDIIRQLMKRQQ
ncbi:MAG: DUF748 domain-containing protein [Candidatus Omnitrophica bacterium]|nr:DUF748 domain-containing protein [Candidatus Omnitrophota bacterium]